MNADPRRPEKVQRYTPKTGNGTGEDLTPDYMNILGQQQTAGNMTEEKHPEPSVILEPNLQLAAASVDDVIGEKKQNVIPTSPQYGVAIIPNANPIPNTNPNPNPNPNEESVVAVENENTTTTIATKLEDKELHSTPSRNDRFKVVKIASLEPFKRGRWKCMDYVDESPPNTNTNTNRILPQSTYMQTQSLPQQQIQQMLLQTATHPQFFTPQLIPQNQFFYPQNIPQQVPQFIGNQYFQNVLPNTQNFNIPQSYPNVQYIPIQNQNSAFVVPTSQPVQVQLPTNFQQSQSYAGIGVSQTNVVPLMNGHGTNNEPVSNPTGKNIILTTPTPQPTVANQTQLVQQQNPPTQQYQPNNNSNNNNPQQQINNHNQLIQSQSFDHQNLANNVYRNPQFTMSVNSLTVLENSENSTNLTETNSANANSENNIEDPSKSNPVVNAIDNKIEQAMDLVKSHLMYTVREEVEVLKEKIAELMEKIQQLETENNFLRSQIPKSQQQNNAGFSADGNNVGESGNSQ